MANEIDFGRTTRARRLGKGWALLVAPWFFVVANAADAWMTRDGGSDLTSKGALAIAAAHPDLDRWASCAAMIGSLLLIPAVLGAMDLLRVRAAWLGLVAGVLMIAGYVCYFALVFAGYTTDAMAAQGGSIADYVAILDRTQNQGFTIWPGLIFVVGNFVGTLLLGLALFRSRVVARWASIAVIAWPVLHIFGGVGEVAGALIEAVGLTVVGLQVLRTRPVPLPVDVAAPATHDAAISADR